MFAGNTIPARRAPSIFIRPKSSALSPANSRARLSSVNDGSSGFRIFFPKTLRNVRHARKLTTVHAAAFPGYLFVALDLRRDRWRAINGTIGVARLVTFDERPAPVPVGIVESLIALTDSTGLARFDAELVEGQSVRIIHGPFAEAVGRLLRAEAGDRVRVLLEIMGGDISVSAPRSALVAA